MIEITWTEELDEVVSAVANTTNPFYIYLMELIMQKLQPMEVFRNLNVLKNSSLIVIIGRN